MHLNLDPILAQIKRHLEIKARNMIKCCVYIDYEESLYITIGRKKK